MDDYSRENGPGGDNPGAKARRASKKLLQAGIMLGIGLVGALDEIVLHQLLQWHNFYVHTDQFWRIFSDGLFHIFTAGLLFLGALQLWFNRHLLSRAGRGQSLAAGLLFGMGGFQLFDGTINHKILQIHPIREGAADQLPYDLIWNIFALALLGAGWLLWRRVKAAPALPASGPGDSPRNSSLRLE